jgi:hypothetical protein
MICAIEISSRSSIAAPNAVDAAAVVADLEPLALDALTRCRYWLPFTRHSTISPTEGTWSPSGSTVQSCPLSILPTMLLPRGRNCTVSPRASRAMWPSAHPMTSCSNRSDQLAPTAS